MKKLLILITFSYALTANAQDYLITFAGEGASSTVSSVYVENLTSGTSLVINGYDILHLISITTGVNSIKDDQLSKIKIYPNPMINNSTIQIYPPIAGDANITVVDITGKPVATIQSYLENSRQDFKLSGLKNGFYLINVNGSNYQFSGKLVSNGNANGTITIEKISSSAQMVDKKVSEKVSKGVQATVDMAFTTGDRLKFTGTSGVYSTVKTDIPESNKTITFNFIACSDGDANNYPVVEIGDQVWMVENLKTTKYSDGTDIPYVREQNSSQAAGTPSYCWFLDKPELSRIYGAWYNGYALDVASNGNKNICPNGWHVPTHGEWIILQNYLIANGFNYDGSTSGNKIAKSLCATTGWRGMGSVGSPGYDIMTNNSSGFTAYATNAITGSLNWETCDLWSVFENSESFVSVPRITFRDNYLSFFTTSKGDHLCIRCLLGDIPLLPVLTTTIVSNITETTASSGGEIKNDGGETITAHGVCWSTSAYPTIIDSKTINGSGTGTFTSSITGLDANTIYYVRAYATTSSGTSYGNQFIFKTYTGNATDIEGNVYKTVTIGTQIWMAENLKTSKYRDGTSIPKVTDDIAWSNLSTAGYCWYNNDRAANNDTYGILYNWYTVEGGDVCPIGWQIPSDYDWKTLTDFLIYSGYTYQGSITNIVKSLASNSGWITYPLAGTIGNDQASNNLTGFSALPGGARNNDGKFRNIGNYSGWWSASEFGITSALSRSMYYNGTEMISTNDYKNDGLSVRCILEKGQPLPVVTTSIINNITENSVSSGGNVTSEGGSPVTAYGVCWSTSLKPTIEDNLTINGTGTGVFTSSIIGLKPNTIYHLRAYAANSLGTSYGKDLVFKTYTGKITDIEGNIYNTVTIGIQVWIAENLKTTKYNDGTNIQNVTENTAWDALSTSAFCWYSNNEALYKSTYGALYNWYAVNTSKLCPTGWHVPSDAEWTTLTTFLGGITVAGGKLKETGTTHWWSPNTGATNESGFTSLPGGERYYTMGVFAGIGDECNWWSASESTSLDAFSRGTIYDGINIAGFWSPKKSGFSVRCIKDN